MNAIDKLTRFQLACAVVNTIGDRQRHLEALAEMREEYQELEGCSGYWLRVVSKLIIEQNPHI